MSGLASRVVVAGVLLPVVLGAVWLGGWWLLALASAVAVLALHEFYLLTRGLRPVRLAGFIGTLAALLGASLGGADWVVAGLASTFVLALLLKGIAGTRQSTTVSVAATVLGAGWIGLGLGHVVLLREIPENGQLAGFAVLLSVFASDTAAYFVGRLVGRHRLAPRISPGKTWEGFVAGAGAALFVAWISLYDTGFVDGWRSLVLGGAIAVAGALGDLFESALKRDANVKDTSSLLAGHGGVLDRLDSVLFSSVAAYYVIAAFGAS